MSQLGLCTSLVCIMCSWCVCVSRVVITQGLFLCSDALYSLQAVPVSIKWPNDIYYQSKMKLGGILISCFSASGSVALTAVIGEYTVSKCCTCSLCSKQLPIAIEKPETLSVDFAMDCLHSILQDVV